MKNLVFVGGWSTNHSTYLRLVRQAPSDWKVYLISPHTLLKTGHLRDSNQRLGEFVSSHGLPQFYLAGHSLGGAMAIGFAATQPKGLMKLVLIDSEGIYGQEKFIKAALTHLKSQATWRTEILWRNLKTMFRILSHPINHFRLARQAVFIDVSSTAQLVKVPALILWGGRDHSTPLWQAEKLERIIISSQLEVLVGKNHNWVIDDPKPFWNYLETANS